MRGRRPIPTSLKVMNGNPGKRPLNENEPQPKTERPSCPPELSKLARKEWKRILPMLEELRIVAQIDRSALAAYCQSFARWIEAEEKITETSLVIKTKSGNVIENPYYSIAKRERELKSKLAVVERELATAKKALSRAEEPTSAPFESYTFDFNSPLDQRVFVRRVT